jgi:rhodanese-related sulfurtransferase
VISRALRQATLLLVVAFVPAIGQAVYYRGKVSWQSRLTSDQTVDVDLARSWGENAIWVDARPDDEFARDHVPGAISLNEDRWNELLPEFLSHWSPEKKIVVYCSSKSCNLADEVARRLRDEAKLPNDIRVLSGGWEDWLKRGR